MIGLAALPSPVGPAPAAPRLILVTGAARSGTSLVAGALHALGAQLGGETAPGNAQNPRGYFEHLAIREEVTKRYLREIGADPLGVDPLPPLGEIPSAPWLRAAVFERLRARPSWPSLSVGPIVLKDAKLALIWPVWAEAFPDAVWVVVRRHPRAIVASCMRTPWMCSSPRAGSSAFWARWWLHHDARLRELERRGACVVRSDRVARGLYLGLMGAARAAGLRWDAEAVRRFVVPGALRS